MHMPIPGVCMRYFYITTNRGRGTAHVVHSLPRFLPYILNGVTHMYMNKLLIWLIIMGMISSCAIINSKENIDKIELTPVESGVECAPPRIELASGVVWDVREDAPRLLEAERGCIRYYGKGACLTVFYKKSRLNYHAICRRQN